MSTDLNHNYWVIVSSEENFEITKSLGFTIQGIKSRHRKKAQAIHPGDKLIYYVTGLQVLSSIVTVTSDYWEEHTSVWKCKSNRDTELYPFRFKIMPDVILEKSQYLPVVELVPQIQYLKKWPAAHWHLGFQGNVHHWPESDYQLVYNRMLTIANPEGTHNPIGSYTNA